MTDTIAAIATPPGAGGVGIVRVSGANLDAVIHILCRRALKPRYATYTPFYDSAEQVIDQGIALYFPAPHSFTGESVLELHAHGGRFVLDAVLSTVLSTGVRLAEPGEFSYRAYLNGKMDLIQAEAVSDMITAGSEQAMRSAAQSLQGQFSEAVNNLRKQLNDLRVYIEASIDFTDEEIDFLSEGAVGKRLQAVSHALTGLLDSAQQGALLQEGATLAIVGSPNVGKSSILNQLTGRASAIVTSQAGTTRDTLKEYIECDGLPIHVIDTAGIRETDDIVEQEGITRAWKALAAADAVLWVSDLTQYPNQADDPMGEALRAQLDRSVPVIRVGNKKDAFTSFDTSSGLRNDESIGDPSPDTSPGSCNDESIGDPSPDTSPGSRNDESIGDPSPDTSPGSRTRIRWGSKEVKTKGYQVILSAKTGDGIDDLRQAIVDLVGYRPQAETPFLARRRHVDALERADKIISQCSSTLLQDGALELLAEELLAVDRCLGELTGQTTADELLGDIFSSFCIGK